MFDLGVRLLEECGLSMQSLILIIKFTTLDKPRSFLLFDIYHTKRSCSQQRIYQIWATQSSSEANRKRQGKERKQLVAVNFFFLSLIIEAYLQYVPRYTSATIRIPPVYRTIRLLTSYTIN